MIDEIALITQKVAQSSHYILYATLLAGALFFSKISPLHRSILIYAGILLLSDYLMQLFTRFYGNTLRVLYIYSFLELAFMVFFYKKYMFRGKQRLIMGVGIAGLTYIIIEMLLIFEFKGLVIKEFQPYAKVVDNFIIVLMALAYLHEKMNRFSESAWGNFRLNMVFLVFFTLNTLIFLPFNFMINAAGSVKFYFWAGHIILLVLFYLYLTFEVASNGLKRTKGIDATTGRVF